MSDQYPNRLTPTEYRLLKHLAGGGEPSADSVAEKLSTHRAYAYELLRRLGARGFVTHKAYDRVSEVAITPEGLQLIS